MAALLSPTAAMTFPKSRMSAYFHNPVNSRNQANAAARIITSQAIVLMKTDQYRGGMSPSNLSQKAR